MNLSKAVQELNSVKNDLKALKTSEKTLTEEIKQELAGQGLEAKILSDINMKVTCKEVTKTEINEDALIKIIGNLIDSASNDDLKDALKSCLLVKTVVDEDKIQELIYKGFISIEDIQPAVIEKSYTRLTIKEVK
jgi:hypothetical protein